MPTRVIATPPSRIAPKAALPPEPPSSFNRTISSQPVSSEPSVLPKQIANPQLVFLGLGTLSIFKDRSDSSVAHSVEVNLVLEQLAKPDVRPHFEWLLTLALASGVTDVLVNGPQECWVDSGAGLKPVEMPGIPERELNHLARLIAALGDRHLDQIVPVADVSLGSQQLALLAEHGVARLRMHLALASAVTDQTLISVRVHRAGGFTLEQLCETGMVDQDQLQQLSTIIKQRANFLICGPTGSGKSTLLRAMLAQDPELRTIVVEDATELVPMSGHVLGLQVRQANVEGAGFIGLEELAREALRMRPDRLVVGEVRGAEAAVLLQAMSTGNSGSAGTLHANSIDAVLPRLRGLAGQAGIGAAVFDELFQHAVDAVIQLESKPIRHIAKIQWEGANDKRH